MIQFVDAENHGLSPVLVLALMSVSKDSIHKVIVSPFQRLAWNNAGMDFPNTLGQKHPLIAAYVNTEVQVDAQYDPTRVGVMDQNETIFAEIVNLAIPE